MNYALRMLPALIAMLVVACGGTDQPAEPADLVLTNAYVYTADKAQSVAEYVAIRGDAIVYVGNAAGAAELVGDDTVMRDMGGAMLMPGIHDMHIHALGTVEPDMCDLKSATYTLEGWSRY